jgi:hypothetical protein
MCSLVNRVPAVWRMRSPRQHAEPVLFDGPRQLDLTLEIAAFYRWSKRAYCFSERLDDPL